MRVALAIPLVFHLAIPLIAVAMAMAILAGCTGLRPSQFDGATPAFDPVAYLEGPTRSWGVVETRGGEPRRRFRTAMLGVRDGDALVVTQDFTFDDGTTRRRVWRLRQVDAHRYDATASDVIGIATGYAYGNTFRWQYTLQVTAGNPLTRVRMQHWMYLVDGGDTLVNRVVIRKFGAIVGGTTEYFRRGAGETASVGPAASGSPAPPPW